MQNLTESAQAVQTFQDENLGKRIANIEFLLKDADASKVQAALSLLGIGESLFDAALTLKSAAGQINVIIHAVGVLLTVQKILVPDELVQDLSLGAGNTGKPFDLETTQRVAEFKFIHWRGGSETIRQNALFKDFYLLAEYDTPKEKELYVIGTEHPLKFLQSTRSLASVMSRHNKLWDQFQRRYQDRFGTVSDYYSFRKGDVHLRNLLDLFPSLAPAKLRESNCEAG